MLKDRDVEAQSLVILILMGFVVAILNIIFDFTTTVTEYFMFFIAWRVLVIEGTLFK